MRHILLMVMVVGFTLVCVAPVLALDTVKVEQEIFRIVNEERAKNGLDPYRYDDRLADLARIHSQNMKNNSFFSHNDHLGMNPSQRKQKFYPQLLGGIGENIASHYGPTEEQVARNFMTSWMNSPGHRANILSSKYSHIGVGVVDKGGGQYLATQNFSDAAARLMGDLPREVAFGSEVSLKFQFMGKFPKDKITIFVHFPDRSARYYIKSGAFYTGVGLYEPVWEGETFTLNIKCDKGRGVYRITMGSYGSYYPEGIEFEAK